MNKNVFIIGFIFIFIACNSNRKQAIVYLEDAQKLYEQGEYATAKGNLDSIKKLFPKEFEIQKQGLLLKRRVDLKEQERNLNFCDSMLKVRITEAENMKTKFVFEKTAYDDYGKYLDKSQQVEAKLQNSYIRTVVNELGEIQLSSVYHGGRPIHHSHLKVSKANGEYAETEVITHDGGLNYSFVDGGMTTEVVTYSKGKDNGVIQFIYNNKDAILRAEYLDSGKVKYTFIISAGDKDVLSKIFDFAIVLSDIKKLNQEKEKSSQRFKYLEDRLNSKIIESSE